jgi:hypothetical protein
MKKLLTLVLALSIAFAGFAQVQKVSSKNANNVVAQEQILLGNETFENVGNVSTMTRSEVELDYTTYDWQTNTAARNLTMNFPDGCVGFAYTIATDASMTDRGTDVVIYNPATDDWTTVGGKIEDRKTGFGCAARYGENGVVVVSRDANTLNCGVYIIEDKDNLPAPGTVAPVIEWVKDDRNIHFPAVMCTGPNHDHIHILFTALNYVDEAEQSNPFYYFRSMDGGQTWDEFMTIDYLGREYAPCYGSGQDAYFMENKGGNRLDIVVNTRRGDGAVLTSYDEGNTWTRTKFYHHPGIDEDYGENLGYLYPRWTSALWDNAGTLHVAYEIGGATGDATSTSYYPGIGGVAYWNSAMPYRGTEPAYGVDPTNPMPPTAGQPFIMDSAYLYQDIYHSWWLWSDATHEMWPEFIGYVTPLDELDQPLVDPYEATEFNLYDNGMDSHGHYNGGVSEMPVLCMSPDEALMVAVWISMDDHNITAGASSDMAFFKLFTRASFDKGNTWTPMIQLTTDFMYQYSECVYPQAAITNNQLVIACQMDGEPDSFIIGTGGDVDQMDNYYQGLTFDLFDLFGFDAIEEPVVVNNSKMSIFPNPAIDRLNVNLNSASEIVIYNIMGQSVRSVEGNKGLNQIDLSGLNSGVYFISAGSDTQKFIVK